MTPFYADDWLTIYGGDCRTVLSELPADSVDCVVTSPPYWGLRDYGTATWEGGDAECDHSAGSHAWATATEQAKKRVDSSMPFRGACGRCGASRVDSQLGLERTPEEYVADMVAVFREVRRVLKPSGTCWLNLGDSYNGVGRGEKANGLQVAARMTTQTTVRGLKPKDLVGIPWRVVFALQADGWYLRSDIIWSKPNPMPESVTDRPTKSHEYLFLLTKSARYYFDADAVREPIDPKQREWRERYKDTIANWAERNEAAMGRPGANSGLAKQEYHPGGRNIRSVWNIATRPYPGAHFAVFPPELPERCIKAGSSEKGVCPECGAPWERVVVYGEPVGAGTRKRNSGGRTDGYTVVAGDAPVRPRTTTGWRPTCTHWKPDEREYRKHRQHLHTPDPVPAVILDPFGGSGTVGMVANRLSRRAILIDLNPEYLKQQMRRNAQTPLGLTEGDAA